MHIVYIHQYFATPEMTGGTRSYEMAVRLVNAGHRVSMVAGTSDKIGIAGKTGEVLRDTVDGIDCIRVIEPYSNKMSFAKRWRSFLRFAGRACKVIRSLKDVDLVFSTSTPLPAGPAGRKAASIHQCPFVFEVRDRWPELPIAMGLVKNPLLKWYLQQMEKTTYRAADHIIALAPGIADGIAETGYPRNHISVIPNGSDIDRFRPMNDKQQLDKDPRFGPPGNFRLVFTGAHGMANGLDAVMDAAAVLKHRGVANICFCFIGGGGMKASLVERSRREGLNAICRWIDPIPKNELADLLPKMDVGMMILKNIPEFYRGTSPNKFFDYIASGLPVLNNYPGWIAHHIRQSQCGAVVPPDDAEAFADAVLQLRDQREQLAIMGQHARKLAETTFNRDQLAHEFIAALEDTHAKSQ